MPAPDLLKRADRFAQQFRNLDIPCCIICLQDFIEAIQQSKDKDSLRLLRKACPQFWDAAIKALIAFAPNNTLANRCDAIARLAAGFHVGTSFCLEGDPGQEACHRTRLAKEYSHSDPIKNSADMILDWSDDLSKFISLALTIEEDAPARRAGNKKNRLVFKSRNSAWPMQEEDIMPVGAHQTIAALLHWTESGGIVAAELLAHIFRIAPGAAYLGALFHLNVGDDPEDIVSAQRARLLSNRVFETLLITVGDVTQEGIECGTRLLDSFVGAPAAGPDDLAILARGHLQTELLRKLTAKIHLAMYKLVHASPRFDHTKRTLSCALFQLQGILDFPDSHFPTNAMIFRPLRLLHKTKPQITHGIWLYARALRNAGRCSSPECHATKRRTDEGPALPLQPCGACLTTRYCSKTCQKRDWLSEKADPASSTLLGHKSVCPIIKTIHDIAGVRDMLPGEFMTALQGKLREDEIALVALAAANSKLLIKAQRKIIFDLVCTDATTRGCPVPRWKA